MTFERQKTQILSGLDKSKKGSVDSGILRLIDRINSLPDYFTTASWSGRIFLMEMGARKDQTKWLFMSHSKVRFSQLKKILSSISKKPIWFRQECMIIHICCKDMDAAKNILRKCHEAGLKRAGIISLGRKILVEAFGTWRMDTIIAEKGIVIVSDDYLNVLLREANKKMALNQKAIERLNKNVRNFPPV